MDIAPEVDLYIASPLSRGDTLDAVDWMISRGVSVIVRSESSGFDGPGDGTSPFSDSPLKAVDRAVDSGVVWVNSAGNEAQRTWFGPPSLSPLGIMYFSGFDLANDILLEAGDVVSVDMRWDDTWGRATRDFDVCIFHRDILDIGNCAFDIQAGRAGDVPAEFLRYEAVIGGPYEVVVFYEVGSLPAWVQVVVRGVSSIEHYTGHYSITNPAESANPGMLAVGAAPWSDVQIIEPFSSRGPTPDGRVKPDIVGADCGETALRPLNERRRGFCGTSQAAPHVAGMAALVRQRFPEYSPVQIAGYLKDHAEQRESPDPNNTWGHGFAQLPAQDAVAPVFGNPSVMVGRETVLANQFLSISGSGFTPNGCIRQGDVLVNNVPLEITDLEDHGPCDGMVGLTSSGAFALRVILRREGGFIPDALLTAGTHSVIVTDTNGLEGRTEVTIPSRTLDVNPDTDQPRTSVTVSGRNFVAANPSGSSVAVVLEYDCGGGVRTTVSTEPDTSGNFEETLRVPDDCGIPSTNTITATVVIDGSYTITETVPHEIPEAEIMVTPGRAAAGQTVTVTGRGFRPFEAVESIELGPTDILANREEYTDRDGSIRIADLTVPSMAPGTYSLVMKVGEGPEQTSAGTTFEVVEGALPTDPCGQTLSCDDSVPGQWAEGASRRYQGGATPASTPSPWPRSRR